VEVEKARVEASSPGLNWSELWVSVSGSDHHSTVGFKLDVWVSVGGTLIILTPAK
jgi:hypothetical protein